MRAKPNASSRSLLLAVMQAIALSSPLPWANAAPALDRDAAEHMTAVGRHMLSRVVRVHARLADGRTNIGSGIPIAPDLVATNCHVTRSARSVEIAANTMEGPALFAAIAQAAAVGRDVCILRMARPLSVPLARIAPIPAVGEPLVAVGFTGGIAPRTHTGELLRLHPHDGAQVMETSTAFDQGASGGGVFGAAGTLVGLVTFRSLEARPRYFVNPAQWIGEVLETQKFEPIAPHGGHAYWDEPEDRLPDFLKPSP